MSTERRRITLTENDDGRWTARETPAGRTARGETPEAALDALGVADDGTDEEPPAAPLYELVGMLAEDEADRVRERSREFRDEFNERVDRTRRELSDPGRWLIREIVRGRCGRQGRSSRRRPP